MSRTHPGRVRPGWTEVAARVAVASCLGIALVGCSDGVEVIAAEAADDPGCADVLGALPDQLLDRDRRATGAAGAAAWGDPPVVLRCGVTPPGPTTDRCLQISGVDWVVTAGGEQDGSGTYVSYGRAPAVEVTLPPGADPQSLAPLGAAVSTAERTRACL